MHPPQPPYDWPPPYPTPPPKRGLSTGVIVALVVTCVVGLPTMVVIGVYAVGRLVDAVSQEGVAATEAGCRPDERQPAAEDDRLHAPVGEPVEYEHTPPAFGQHWGNYLQGAEVRAFYQVQDRPPVERLVHSLEHGYTILWYDPREADAARDVADEAGPKFIAAPWTTDDGPALRDGAGAVLVHWSIGGVDADGISAAAEGELEEAGVWRYCDHVSGDVVRDFMASYPIEDSHEPTAP